MKKFCDDCKYPNACSTANRCLKDEFEPPPSNGKTAEEILDSVPQSGGKHYDSRKYILQAMEEYAQIKINEYINEKQMEDGGCKPRD